MVNLFINIIAMPKSAPFLFYSNIGKNASFEKRCCLKSILEKNVAMFDLYSTKSHVIMQSDKYILVE